MLIRILTIHGIITVMDNQILNPSSVKKYTRLILSLLFFLNILAWLAVWDLNKPQLLEVIFFDVGQGDAIFIITPKRHQILIDGGPDSTVLEKLAANMFFRDRTIDLLILTHPHSDHLQGLLDVLQGYQVENILWTGVFYDATLYQEWQRAIKEEGAKIYIAQSGQKITGSGAVFEILYPFESFEEKMVRNLDNTSIVVRLVFGENSFLFTGDASQEVELILLNKFQEKLEANVLKVGHHSSKISTAEEFVVGVAPEIAVISAGKDNKYGHPHKEVLDILRKYDINILRTDQDSDIKIISDGENLKLKTKN